MKLSITVTGINEFQKRLRRISYNLNYMRTTWNEIGRKAALYFSTKGYASQGGVFGQRWPRLSPKYAAVKAKLYPGRPPLVRSGEMKDSYAFKANNLEVMVTNTAPQFPFHQSTRPRTKIPRRATMGINDPIRRMALDLLQQGVGQTIRTTR